MYRIASHLSMFRMLLLEAVLPSTMSSNLALNIQKVKLLENKRSGGMHMRACMHAYMSLCVYVGICVFAYV